MRRSFQCAAHLAMLAWIFAGAACLMAAGNSSSPSGSQALNRQFQTALAYYQHQQYDQARQALDGLLKQAPNNFEANELMGLVYSAQEEPALGVNYLAKAAGLRPASAEARMYWAAALTALHQEARAESEFRKAVQLEPANYDANHNLGEFYVSAGNLSAAVPYLKKAEEIEPSSYNNGYDAALAEIKTGKYEEAKTGLERLLRYQNTADLHSLLATANEDSGHYIQAANEYELAAHMSPTEQNIFAWGSELLVHHTLEPAVEVFQRGVEMYPRSAELQVGFGIALYSRTHYRQAIDAFGRAIDLDPNDPRPYQFLGKIYDVSPLEAQAVTDRFARFARLQPHNPQALYYYALSLWKASRTESKAVDLGKVERLLESSLALDPDFAEAHLQLGIFYFRQRRYKDAVGQYRKAIRIQPGLADAHYHLGEALVRTGDREEAQKEFQTFTRLHAEQVREREKERRGIMQFVVGARGRS